MNRQLHIVCFDVPWPPDYGGAIDMMNRILLFKKMGIDIILHYFSYNERGRPAELERLCHVVYVYERKKAGKSLAASLPYIVASRVVPDLIARLQADQHPLLIEGLHCTGILGSLDLSARKIVVRMHNEESTYYRELARSEGSWLKRLYYLRESRMIRAYSKQLPPSCTYACISTDDVQAFRNLYQLPDVRFLPAFPSWQKVTTEEGLGNLCLYHGNLSVPENEKAASWLLSQVFSRIRKPFVIAGKKPSRKLQKLSQLCQHTCLVSDPSESELTDLIRKAQIHVLPCVNKNTTGVHLKLLHALYEGRHCVVNDAMVRGTGLEDACHIGANAQAFASIIAQLYRQPFTAEEISLRTRLLASRYDNEENIRRLIQYLW